VLSAAETERLRELLIETTRTGTARRAFQRRGRALLAPVTVAGKTGSLSGKNPDGRYEWFVGVAPAERPEISIAVLTVHRGYWLRSSSQLAAEVLRQVFCPNGICSADAADRWLGDQDQHPS
jgi:cell division protein FtsI/penicillin-binding protein 2